MGVGEYVVPPDFSGGLAITPTLLQSGGLFGDRGLPLPSTSLGIFHTKQPWLTIPMHQTPGLLLPSSIFLNNFWKGHGFSIHTNRPPLHPSTH